MDQPKNLQEKKERVVANRLEELAEGEDRHQIEYCSTEFILNYCPTPLLLLFNLTWASFINKQGDKGIQREENCIERVKALVASHLLATLLTQECGVECILKGGYKAQDYLGELPHLVHDTRSWNPKI